MGDELQLSNISTNELEQCLKCTICTAYCPVAAVTPFYPGPKHAGPDGERYRIKDAKYFDEKALKMCLNCKRCEVACPEGVKIGDIIQAARIKYSTHRPSLRDWTMGNTDLVGSIATRVAPIVNMSLKLKPAKAVMDMMIGLDKTKTMPSYSSQRFETWFKKHALPQQSKYTKKVSYFHGCYVNYNFPKLGQDFVKLMNAIGYGVSLLDKEKCCGVALIANGMSSQAKRQGDVNIKSMTESVSKGMPVLTTSSTCTFTMREEYPHLLHINNDKVKDSLSLATRFIYQLVESGKVNLVFRKDYKKRIAYHSACHMERLGWIIYSTSLLKMIPGVDFVMLDSMCCGQAGTYAFKKENHDVASAIGSPLFKLIEEVHPDLVATDCETCKWQIEMSTSAPVENPISILADALDVEATKALNS
ncbi:MAG: anaerobic glycerol-3-phosphate dehydrogenase subunit GlpC [Prevotellaceae bacterium]|nr:anaerobic glycerol-3-phosphate dehydrogenase subunit GlpC [Prevotellaceae bacterium]MDY3857238.1 anaerobic glycerol-3-phosphate dehydrogenase subunit GlpC [Bacteroidaceae bacterium]